MAKNEPVFRVRLGRIAATVWKNRSDQGAEWYRVNITRSWKDGDEWKETTSFDLEDLPLVSQAAMMAYSWIWERRVTRTEEKTSAVA